jgi:acetylornithine deacetylase
LDFVTRVLSDLVAIPSVNPMGRPLSGPGFLEGGVSNYLEHFFHDRQIRFERRHVSPGRDNVLAWYQAPGATRTILFDAHQDTVPTDAMTIAPFVPEIADGRLFGRGSCDDKGGMAAMLAAVARLAHERPERSASVIMACTVDEEFTHTGSSHLAAERQPADLGIVAEPTQLNLVHTHKGALRWKIRTRGVACHSSAPRLGQNAIYRMAHVVTALEEYADKLTTQPGDPVLGPRTLSVGRIEGGQSVNVVPDWSEIEVDRRVIPGERTGDLPAHVWAFLRERLGDLSWLEFQPPWVNLPPLAPAVPNEWLSMISDVVRGRTGQTPSVGGVPFGTDAGALAEAGLPCVVIGPGDIAQAHTKDEWIELDQVRLAAEIYFDIACALG